MCASPHVCVYLHSSLTFTVADLTTQRATIEGMQDRLSDINANLERSEGLMRSIYRNMMFNKVSAPV